MLVPTAVRTVQAAAAVAATVAASSGSVPPRTTGAVTPTVDAGRRVAVWAVVAAAAPVGGKAPVRPLRRRAAVGRRPRQPRGEVVVVVLVVVVVEVAVAVAAVC